MKIRIVLNASMLLLGILGFFGSVKAQGGAVPTAAMQEYMRSHPEGFLIKPDGTVELKQISNESTTKIAAPETAPVEKVAEPTYMPVFDPKAAPVTFEWKSLPESKQAYMRAHPEEFTIRPDGFVEMKVTASGGVINNDVKREDFEMLSPEKQAYILAHPDQYNLLPKSEDQ